jgi:hypothetical protein
VEGSCGFSIKTTTQNRILRIARVNQFCYSATERSLVFSHLLHKTKEHDEMIRSEEIEMEERRRMVGSRKFRGRRR